MKRLLILALMIFLVGCSSNSHPTGALAEVSGQGGATGSANTRDERIRGNKRSMIYHWPGCPNYDDIAPNNRVYFKTRAEAEAAGYRAAKNCP
jgi:hypothetical protein